MPREFNVIVTTNKRTGDLLAVYFQIRRGKAAKVREFEDGNAFANYNNKGELLGVELLGPCNVTVVDRIVLRREADVRKFIKRAAPMEMLVGAR